MPVGLTSSIPVYPSSIGTGIRPESPAPPGGQATATVSESRRPVSSGSESARSQGADSNRPTRSESNRPEQGDSQGPVASSDDDSDRSGANAERGIDGQALTRGEQREVRQLEARNREVRAHEKAHQSAGGQYAGSPQYSYTQGPAGDRYATGGEVSIDASPIKGDPQATLEKMRTVRAAALAPPNPSAQDQQVAAEATQAMLQAQLQLAGQESGSGQSGKGTDTSADSDSGTDRSSRESATTSYQSVAQTGDGADTEPFRASA